MFKCLLLATLAICCMPSIDAAPSRVSGGESSEINKAPYLVSIRYKKNSSSPFEHRCSGTIYSPKVILTTATCLLSLDAKLLHVKAGSTYRTQVDGYLYLVEKYIIHPAYNIWYTDNDLALIILAFNLTQSLAKTIAPININTHVPPVGSLATIAGWGLKESGVNSNFSENLRIGHVNLLNGLDCKQSYGENRISQAMLCAAKNDVDACLGDAGGALVYQNSAIGLISWGFGCSGLNWPSVYTNLVYFKDWIESELVNL